VVFVSDKLLANNTICVPKFDESRMIVDKGVWSDASNVDQNNMEAALAKFPRFAITEDGISPRAVPGMPGHIYWMTGDEHTEYGHITEDPPIRIPMQEKRMKKLDLVAKEIPQENQYKYHNPTGAANPPITIVSWGSTKGVILDSIRVLKEQHGLDVDFLQIRMLNPFPTEAVTQHLKKAQRVVMVEASYTGQLSQLITMRTGIQLEHEVLKWSGRPISETELIAAIKEIHEKQSRKVVLSYGL
jgi:2-oxoglutarate ferredoxin oxidoreductase subunit alpha